MILCVQRADPKSVNNRGTTALHVAAKLGSPLVHTFFTYFPCLSDTSSLDIGSLYHKASISCSFFCILCRLLSWILVKNAGDPSLVGIKDKNGYTASDHASMGKTNRYIATVLMLYEF